MRCRRTGTLHCPHSDFTLFHGTPAHQLVKHRLTTPTLRTGSPFHSTIMASAAVVRVTLMSNGLTARARAFAVEDDSTRRSRTRRDPPANSTCCICWAAARRTRFDHVLLSAHPSYDHHCGAGPHRSSASRSSSSSFGIQTSSEARFVRRCERAYCWECLTAF